MDMLPDQAVIYASFHLKKREMYTQDSSLLYGYTPASLMPIERDVHISDGHSYTGLQYNTFQLATPRSPFAMDAWLQ